MIISSPAVSNEEGTIIFRLLQEVRFIIIIIPSNDYNGMIKVIPSIAINTVRELPLPCGTVVPMEEASDSRNNYSSLTRRFWLFVPIRAYSLMPLSL